MTTFLTKVIDLLTEQHGKSLDLQNEVYYLFLEDGMVSVYLDDQDQLKVDVECLDEYHVYESNIQLKDLY